jgi:hypothetical protein
MSYLRCRGFMTKEGNALRQTNGKREPHRYPQSWGNLALSDEGLAVLQIPKAKIRSPRLSVVRDIAKDEAEIEALAPTTGIINGVRLSLTLWSFIGVIVLLMQ